MLNWGWGDLKCLLNFKSPLLNKTFSETIMADQKSHQMSIEWNSLRQDGPAHGIVTMQ